MPNMAGLTFGRTLPGLGKAQACLALLSPMAGFLALPDKSAFPTTSILSLDLWSLATEGTQEFFNSSIFRCQWLGLNLP